MEFGYTDQQNYGYAARPPQEASPYAAREPFTVQETRAPQEAPKAAKPKKERGGRRRAAGVAALVLVTSLLSGAAGAGAVTLYNNAHPAQSQSQTQEQTQKSAAKTDKQTAVDAATLRESGRTAETKDTASVPAGEVLTAAEVYEANVNSTVGVTTSITTNYWGYKTEAAAAGSGFIVTETGYIVTNYHVVEDSDSITVACYDGESYPAELVGYDVSNDLAVLKVDAGGLVPVTLGNSDALKVGEDVIAIGNPLGELTFSLSKGAVSALDRTVTLSGDVTMNLIQTDAAINSGNSGGALFNMYGEVIGITNAKYSSSGSRDEASVDNIGFAIPINSVKRIITEIIKTGKYTAPYLGVTVKDASNAALIYSVEKDTGAAAAGLQENDLVTAADGKKITSAADLIAAVKTKSPGDTITLTVKRDGKTMEITATLGEKPSELQTAQPEETQPEETVPGRPERPGRSQEDAPADEGTTPGYDFGYGFEDLLPYLPDGFADMLP